MHGVQALGRLVSCVVRLSACTDDSEGSAASPQRGRHMHSPQLGNAAVIDINLEQLDMERMYLRLEELLCPRELGLDSGLTCDSKRLLCSTGSLSSVYALHISWQLAKSSKRSVKPYSEA